MLLADLSDIRGACCLLLPHFMILMVALASVSPNSAKKIDGNYEKRNQQRSNVQPWIVTYFARDISQTQIRTSKNNILCARNL